MYPKIRILEKEFDLYFSFPGILAEFEQTAIPYYTFPLFTFLRSFCVTAWHCMSDLLHYTRQKI